MLSKNLLVLIDLFNMLKQERIEIFCLLVQSLKCPRQPWLDRLKPKAKNSIQLYVDDGDTTT